MGSLPKATRSSIYQALFEYRVLTQAAQLNIAKGYAKYDDLVSYQASLDNRASESIIKAMEKLQRETIEYWYYSLIDNEKNGLVAMNKTIEELKDREENENN
jgi:hypothetical protein